MCNGKVTLMKQDNWPKIKKIIDQVLLLPEKERESAIVNMCRNDQALLQEVRSYLEMETNGSGFLSTPFYKPPSPEDIHHDYQPGQRIGAYLLQEVLGTGGMGMVFLAHRGDDTFQKNVAIKILKPIMAQREVSKKFNNERQILANLNHTYIAQLYDGGTTEKGDPYFVMEYVKGQYLDQYCRQELSLGQRLSLFQKICSAVGHAHQAGVIHRDLKPSNILVKPNGDPKLLDFGIAKIFDPTHGDASKTQTHFQLMTPKFASPEQIEEQAVHETSDIYCLGTLLYIMLTGYHPLIEKGDSPSTIRERISKKRPIPPSTRIRTEQKTKTDTGNSTNRTTQSYIRRLSGDLDQIVMHCLEKEPQLRYQDIPSLSGDVERFQKGLPILAKPTPIWVRLKKAISRHRDISLFAGISLLIMIGLFGWMLSEKRKSTENQKVATVAKTEAEREKERAQAVFDFTMSFFDQYDPMVDGNDQIPSVEIVRRATEKLNMELLDDWRSEAEIYHRIGNIFYYLLDFNRARDLLSNSLEIYLEQPNATPEEKSRTMSSLARVFNATRDQKRAHEYSHEAYCIAEEHYGAGTPKVAPYVGGIADVLGGTERASGSIVAQHALNLFDPIAKLEPETQAGLLQSYAASLRISNDLPKSIEYYQRALTLAHDLYSPDFPLIGFLFVELGYSYRNMSKYLEAGENYQIALEIFEKKLGPDHAALSLVLGRLGAIQRINGNYQAAEKAYLRAIKNSETTYGPDYSGLAVRYNDTGVMYKTWEKFDEAIVYLNKSIANLKKNAGEEHPALLHPMNSLGLTFIQKRQFEKALEVFREAEKLVTKNFKPQHRLAMPIWAGFAQAYSEQGHLDKAEPYADLALEAANRNLKFNLPSRSWYYNLIGDLKLYQGNLEEAEVYYSEVFSWFTDDVSGNNNYFAQSLQSLARLFRGQNRWQEAYDHCQEAIAQKLREQDIENPRFQDLLCLFAEIQEGLTADIN